MPSYIWGMFHPSFCLITFGECLTHLVCYVTCIEVAINDHQLHYSHKAVLRCSQCRAWEYACVPFLAFFNWCYRKSYPNSLCQWYDLWPKYNWLHSSRGVYTKRNEYWSMYIYTYTYVGSSCCVVEVTILMYIYFKWIWFRYLCFLLHVTENHKVHWFHTIYVLVRVRVCVCDNTVVENHNDWSTVSSYM